MTNSEHIRLSLRELYKVQTDLEEKLEMIEAEETHDPELADREEELQDVKERLDVLIDELNDLESNVD